MGGRTRVGVVSGPLAPWADGYGVWLRSRGYSPGAVRDRLLQLGRLSCWLDREGLSAGELTLERVEAFLRVRVDAGCRTGILPRSVSLPLGYLREVGAVPSPAVDGRVEGVLAGYRRYLLTECGVCEATASSYEPAAREFLSDRAGREGLGLERLTAAEVSGFFARECPLRTVSVARVLVTVARSLLRYLHLAGLTPARLDWAVPAVAPVRGRSLPRGLRRETVAQLLASCDRRRVVGRRDYAILLLLVRLGLRASELAAIELDDLDWRAGEVLVRGKGGRRDLLPLPVDIGEALAGYLRHRGHSEHRAVFLKMVGPGEPICRHTVGGLVREACFRAGIDRVAPHQLRHTAASGMLAAGASLAEIAQVMRHSQQTTTETYARVDRVALRAVALPWPEVTA